MTELDIELTSIYTEMENFLRAQARKEPASTQSIYLKAEYKNGLRLIDNDKRQYNVEETYLSAFRDTYTDKACIFFDIQSRPFAFKIGSSNSLLPAKNATRSPLLPTMSSLSPTRPPKSKSMAAISSLTSSRTKQKSGSYPLR